MSMLGGGTEVVVEPTKSSTAPGGVKWHIRKNGFSQSQHNYKNDAVKKARKLARSEGGSLKVLNKDMSVSETASY